MSDATRDFDSLWGTPERKQAMYGAVHAIEIQIREALQAVIQAYILATPEWTKETLLQHLEAMLEQGKVEADRNYQVQLETVTAEHRP